MSSDLNHVRRESTNMEDVTRRDSLSKNLSGIEKGIKANQKVRTITTEMCLREECKCVKVMNI